MKRLGAVIGVVVGVIVLCQSQRCPDDDFGYDWIPTKPPPSPHCINKAIHCKLNGEGKPCCGEMKCLEMEDSLETGLGFCWPPSTGRG